MVTVSEEAQKQVAAYFKNNAVRPVRIFLHQGCGGARIGLMVDDKKDSDMVFKVDGFEYVVEKELLKKAQPIAVDFQGEGFTVSSQLELGGGCGGCGSGRSCCS